MNVRRAANGARTRTDARSHSLALLTVGALLLPTLFLSLGATDADAAPMPMAQAEVLYGVVPAAGGTNSMLVIVDLSDGSTSTVGLIGAGGVTGLAFADHDTLYGITINRLLVIDPDTGAGDLSAFPGSVFGSPVYDISIRPSDGTIFGVTFVSEALASNLGTIDTAIGLFAPFASDTFFGKQGEGNGLAFLSDDTLYNASGLASPGFIPGLPPIGSSSLLLLDDSNGTGAFVATITDSGTNKLLGGYTSMAAAADDTLFASRSFEPPPFSTTPEEHSFVTIDQAGVVTPIGDTTAGLDGLAFRPPPAGGGGPVAFASFEVTKLDLKKKNGDFHIHAKFRLGAGNNGVDILGEPFTFQVINPDNDEILFELNLPDAGGVSFSEKRTNKFQYKAHNKSTKEKVDIKIDLKKNGEYKFHAKGKHAAMNLGDLERNALVRVKLTIGDDSGDVSGVRAKIKK